MVLTRGQRNATFLLSILLLAFRGKAFVFHSQSSKVELIGHPLPWGTALFATDDGNGGQPPRRVRPLRPGRSSAFVAKEAQKLETEQRHAEALKDPTLLTKIQFADRDDIHPHHKRALTEVLGLKQMTEIQAKCWGPILAGDSVLGRARTGTGKSIAFLLPAIERLLTMDPKEFRPGKNIGILVVAPTRELVIQLAELASVLLKFQNDDWVVMSMYGGTTFNRDRTQLSRRLPAVLVATPGRLEDHIKETRIHGRKFSDILSGVQILVLDETDRLAEGFQREVNFILSSVPRSEKRQTLLFSATTPKRLSSVLDEIMPSDYKVIDCVDNKKEVSEVNFRVKQYYFVLPSMELYASGLLAILRKATTDDPNFKIAVFLPTARLVRLFMHLTNELLQVKAFEIHSRMSQGSRNRSSSSFRNARSAILFTSDVSARGVDYPDITLVIQYGAPINNEAYLHRLGRTGRGGMAGNGLLVLLPFEKKVFPRKLMKDIEPAEDYLLECEHGKEQGIKELTQKDSATSTAVETALASFVAYYVQNAPRELSLSAIRSFAQDVSKGVQMDIISHSLIDQWMEKIKVPPRRQR